MKETKIFPYYDYQEERLKNGIVENSFIFCNRNFNAKCKEHYKTITGMNGIFICPYGFSTINYNNENYPSILIEGNHNKKLSKRNTNKKDSKVVHSLDVIDKIKNYFQLINARVNAKQHIIREYDKESSVISTKKEILDDTLHELRKLNNILKKQAYTLKNELEKKHIIDDNVNLRSKNILSTTQLISARLNAYDFTLNPELIELSPKNNVVLYKKFYKARQCLEVITNELKTKIIMKGSSNCKFECYNIIDLLPFILFENAIKYNYENSPISCEFVNIESRLSKIIVSNQAILPSEKEISKLKDKHFRGENISNITGSGKGLYIADLICGFNNFFIEIELHKEKEIENNKAIGTFKTIITTANTM